MRFKHSIVGSRRVLRWLYGKIRTILPSSAQIYLSRLIFRFGGGPRIYVDVRQHPRDGLARGVATFSADFEMAWAWQYAKGLDEDCVTIGLRERRQVPQILEALDAFGIPVTWATVGHLFLKDCRRGHEGLAHAALARPTHFESRYLAFTEGDWFQHDPCGDVNSAPAWYAPDLVEAVLRARVGHEMACHTFSHVSFGRCTPAVAEAELDACLAAMAPYGLRPKTLVFPTNEAGCIDAVQKKGFSIVRGLHPAQGVVSLPIRRPDGLWCVHDSSGIEVHGAAWNLKERLARLKAFVDAAASSRMAAHFWFHPSIQTAQLHEVLLPLLRYCAGLSDEGVIDILTMEQLVHATGQALRSSEGRAP